MYININTVRNNEIKIENRKDLVFILRNFLI